MPTDWDYYLNWIDEQLLGISNAIASVEESARESVAMDAINRAMGRFATANGHQRDAVNRMLYAHWLREKAEALTARGEMMTNMTPDRQDFYENLDTMESLRHHLDLLFEQHADTRMPGQIPDVTTRDEVLAEWRIIMQNVPALNDLWHTALNRARQRGAGDTGAAGYDVGFLPPGGDGDTGGT